MATTTEDGKTDDYQLEDGVPSAKEYLELRTAAGLSPKSRQGAERGLAATVYGVVVRRAERLVGMGRVIGDGGCFYQIVDIAVRPEDQRRGLGTQILERIVAYLDGNAPANSYVSLLADPPGRELYERYGFLPTAPHSIGMYRRY